MFKGRIQLSHTEFFLNLCKSGLHHRELSNTLMSGESVLSACLTKDQHLAPVVI